jgi:hypothetical protein
MFCAGGTCTMSVPADILEVTPWHVLWLAVAAALATPLRAALTRRFALAGEQWRETAGSMLLLVLSAMALAGGTYNAFLYFRF